MTDFLQDDAMRTFEFPENSKVKLYEMDQRGDWQDMGTGIVELIEVDGVTRITVTSETSPNSLVLLDVALLPENGYQQQVPNVIIIAEKATKAVRALSFQDKQAKQTIWFALCDATGITEDDFDDLVQTSSEILSEQITEEPCSPAFVLPVLSLQGFESVINVLAQLPQQGELRARWLRVHVPLFMDATWIAGIPALLSAGEIEAETSPAIKHMVLPRLFVLAKALLLLPSPDLLDRLAKPDIFPSLLGMLEYDPETSTTPHRQFFNEKAKFRCITSHDQLGVQAVDLIHETFRLLYLKDVALARFLDDNAFVTLTQLCMRNYSEIFAQMAGLSAGNCFNSESVVDLLEFLYSITHVCRTIALDSKERLLDALICPSSISLLADAFLSGQAPEEKVSRCIEVFASISLSRPQSLRSLELINHLSQLIISDSYCEGINSQAADLARYILDPNDNDLLLRNFYSSNVLMALLKTCKSVQARPFSRQACLDFTGYCAQSHGYLAKQFFTRNASHIEEALRLAIMHDVPRIVQLSGVRLFRLLLGLRDPAVTRALEQVWFPLLAALSRDIPAGMTGGGLLFSSVSYLLDSLWKDRVVNVTSFLLAETSETLKLMTELSSSVPAARRLLDSRNEAPVSNDFVLKVRDSVFLERHLSSVSDPCLETQDLAKAEEMTSPGYKEDLEPPENSFDDIGFAAEVSSENEELINEPNPKRLRIDAQLSSQVI